MNMSTGSRITGACMLTCMYALLYVYCLLSPRAKLQPDMTRNGHFIHTGTVGWLDFMYRIDIACAKARPNSLGVNLWRTTSRNQFSMHSPSRPPYIDTVINAPSD